MAARTTRGRRSFGVRTALTPLALGGLLLAASPALDAAPASAQAVRAAYGPTVVITVTCTIFPTYISCTITGSGFGDNLTITVDIFSTPTLLGTVQSDANGNFSSAFVLPKGIPAGQHTVTASDPAGHSASTTVFLSSPSTGSGTTSSSSGASGTGTSSGGGGSSGSGGRSGLAFTGADVTATAAVGAAAIAGGGLLVLSSRKRRRRGWGIK